MALPVFSMEDYCNENDTYELPEVEVSWERDDNSRDDDREWWERDHDTNTDDDLNDNQTDEDITRDDGDSSSDKDGKDTGKDITTIIIKNELTEQEMKDLLKTISYLMEISPYFETLFNYLITNYVMVENIKIDGSINGSGEINYETREISFKNTNYLVDTRTVAEEFFHLYQHHYYPNGLASYTNVGRSNIEFEAKLFYDIHYSFIDMDCCIAFKGDSPYFNEYIAWLDKITNDGYDYLDWESMEEKYYYFLEIFIKENPEYDYPIDYTLKPDGLLNFK